MADEIFKGLADEIHSRRLKCFIFADLGSSSSFRKKRKKKREKKKGEKKFGCCRNLSIISLWSHIYIGTYMYIYVD